MLPELARFNLSRHHFYFKLLCVLSLDDLLFMIGLLLLLDTVRMNLVQ